MEEVRQLVQEEGREARNLVTFHVAVDTPARLSRKPPRVGLPGRRLAPTPAPRLRSASAGRDKRSELRARYWALLFGDLQRAIGEIYNTVEAHENLNECQEVILVLENYTRDFKALGEWFRLKWEYDNTPPPQRPQSLAWEIRKTDFVRIEPKRPVSVKSSPSVSGKNSPCLSGHNTPSGKHSPNLTGKASPASGKVSPRISTGHSITSPKANIEFFSNKISSAKVTPKPEPKAIKLSEIKEKDAKEHSPEDCLTEPVPLKLSPIVELGKAREYTNIAPKQVIIKSPKHNKSNAQNMKESKMNEELSGTVQSTISKLEAMENEFLEKQIIKNAAKNDNMLNRDKETEHNITANKIDAVSPPADKICSDPGSPIKSDDNFADVSNESSNKSDDYKTEYPPDGNAVLDDSAVANNDTNKDTSEIIKDRGKNLTSLLNGDAYLDRNEDNLHHHGDIQLNTDNKTDEAQNTEEKSTIKDIKTDKKDKKVDLKITSEKKETNELKEDRKKDYEFKKPEAKLSDAKPSKPAYSQAAAKPKPASASKTEVKTPVRSSASSLTRSKTVVEMRPATASKPIKQFTKKNQTSKCSYPFNLTTGRTSLFDTTASSSKGAIPKKNITKNIQMAAGDARPSPAKTEFKKRPLKPTSLKITEKGDLLEKMNPNLEKIKDFEDYSSTDTVVTQIDVSRIESSDSLKTLVPEDLFLYEDVANSIEVLNVDNNKNDNEGWLTVKSRRLSRESKKQSKSHWANRFNQPTATTSLPTLNMMESPKQEINPIFETINDKDRAKSEQPTNNDINLVEKSKIDTEEKVEIIKEPVKLRTEKSLKECRKSEKADKPKMAAKNKSESKEKDLSMIRQKSDVTGLKTKSARHKVLSRKEKAKDRKDNSPELTKNRLHSSLESLTGLPRSEESTEEPFDFDKWKEEFKSTFKYLEEDDQLSNHNEILKSADPSEMSEIAEMTSQIEENERKISIALDFQSEVDQRKLCEEEDLLNRQILELQQVSDIDIDTETDDTETDAEMMVEDPLISKPQELGNLAASLEDQYETALQGMSWAERVDTLVVLEALVARDPGRAQQLHAKLSQGIKRRGSLQDALRRLQAKQARAERHRNELQTERAKKIHQLLARVEEVKVAKNQLIEEKRLRMERRLQKAAENRDQHLKDIVRKAHDEDEKLREIAFIKQLEAQNKRHEFVEQCRAHTCRLRRVRRDRLSKLEQKAAREAAVGARRQALEQARQKHVETLLVKSRERDARVEEMREMRKQERGDAAREKAEGVKSRLSALAAAAELEADLLRSRIRDKQDASQQRLESHLQAIREKATGPRTQTLSESQEQNMKDIEEEAVRLERERKERERQKAIKKKARKLKQKLVATNHCCSDDHDCVTNTKQHMDFTFEPFSHPVASKLFKTFSQLSNLLAPFTNVYKMKDPLTPADCHKMEKKKKMKLILETFENGVATDNVKDDNAKQDKKENGVDKIENGVETTTNKKKKKKKSESDKAKVSKTSSVCSSVSDGSKSGKSEKVKVNIDVGLLERYLNELHRIMERSEKSTQEKVVYQKIHGLIVLGQLITLADENEEFAAQINSRVLLTTVTIIIKVFASCSLDSAHFLSLPASAHMCSLLNKLMDKDLEADPKDVELGRQLCDCISIAMDGVLCVTRMSNCGPPELLGEHRARAHLTISYLCWSGCVNKASEAGKIRDSIQTLLTVIAELLHPSPVDVGTERVAATQALRYALGSSLCGAREELCALFADGAGTEHCGQFVKAARAARLLRVIAELDHHFVQDAFGQDGWPIEFRAAVARLLSQHAPSDKEAPRSVALRANKERLDQRLSETMVLDLIALVGFVIVNNPQLQETILSGWNVVKTLCSLPASWLVSRHSRPLLAALLAIAQHEPSRATVEKELSLQMLEDFYNSPEAQTMKLIQVIKEGREKQNAKK